MVSVTQQFEVVLDKNASDVSNEVFEEEIETSITDLPEIYTVLTSAVYRSDPVRMLIDIQYDPDQVTDLSTYVLNEKTELISVKHVEY